MHWQLDVTFREDADHTLDKTAAANMNIIRKWCLSMLKHVPFYKPNLSIRKKMFIISIDPAKHLVMCYTERAVDKHPKIW